MRSCRNAVKSIGKFIFPRPADSAGCKVEVSEMPEMSEMPETRTAVSDDKNSRAAEKRERLENREKRGEQSKKGAGGANKKEAGGDSGKRPVRGRMLKRMLKDLRKIRFQLLSVVGMALTIIACNILSPRLIGGIIGQINDFANEGTGEVGALLKELAKPLVLLAAVYAVYSLFSWLKMYTLNQVVSRRVTCELRIAMADKISRLPVSYLDRTTTGEILARVNNNVSMMGNSIHEAIDVLLMGGLQLIAMGVMLFLENWLMALAVVLLVPLSAAFSTALAKRSMRYYDRLWKSYEQLYSCVEETYGGIETVKSYNMEETMKEKHAAINGELVRLNRRAVFLSSVVQPVIAFTNHLSFIAVCLLGGFLAVRGTVGVAAVVTVVLYAKNFSSPLMQIANGLSSIQHFGSAAKEVYGFLDQEEMTTETLLLPARTEGNVEFCDVGFSYTPEKPLIEHLSFSVKAGQKVAIVGPTGAGKTTIVNLLMRFYDPVSGHIEIDGQNIEACRREDVRDKFSMVLQDTWLFEGTVYENIAYGREGVTREQVEAACRAAYCDRFIRLLPKGYDTVIDDATALSGGQKQLLTIARAFLSDRPLLILDVATSNVDTRTEILIQKAMDRLMKGKTCFVIAHRLSTIVNADMILAVDRGKIVDVGTHAQLLEEGGFYAKLYNSQYAPV